MATLENGPLIIVLDQIRQLVADCYWFRRVTDPDNPWDDETALAHTYIDALPKHAENESYTADELAALRPYAIIEQAGGDGFRVNIETADSCCARPMGHVIIGLRLSVPDSLKDDDNVLGRWAATTVGKIIWTGNEAQPGLLDLGVPPNRIAIRRLNAEPYERVPEEHRKDKGDFLIVDIDVYWGN